MAKQLSDLSATTVVSDNDLFLIRDSAAGVDKKLAASDLYENLSQRQPGLIEMSISNHDNNSAPEIQAGSRMVVNGALVIIASDLAPSGWTGISNGEIVYVEVSSAGTAAFTTTQPSWDDDRQGYYNSNNRVVLILYKGSATIYMYKTIIKEKAKYGLNSLIGRITSDGSPRIDAVLGKEITLTESVNKGDPIFYLHNRWGTGSNYVFKQASNDLDLTGAEDYSGNLLSAYLGDDLFAFCWIESGTPYYLYLAVYEHNWGSASWTKRGSDQVIWSGESNFENAAGLIYLGDVSGQAQIAIITGVYDSATYIYTYQFNKTAYTFSQLGTKQTLYASWDASLFETTANAFQDVWQRFWMIVTTGVSGDVLFKVFDHDGDGTYTERGSALTVFSSTSFRCQLVTDPLKISSTKYLFFIRNTYNSDPFGAFITYDSSDHSKSVVLSFTSQIENNRVYKGYYPTNIWYNGLATGGTPARNLVAGAIAGLGSYLGMAEFPITSSSNDAAPQTIFSAFVDGEVEIENIMEEIAFNVQTGGTTTNSRKLIMLHNNLFLWAAAVDAYYSSASHWEDAAGLVLFDGNKIKPLTYHLIRTCGGPTREMTKMFNTYDGRIHWGEKYANVGEGWNLIYYVPKLVGFADQNYSAGDIIKPVIKGNIRGLTTIGGVSVGVIPIGSKLGWNISTAEICPNNLGLIPVGRFIKDDIMEVDVPMNGYDYECIDQRS